MGLLTSLLEDESILLSDGSRGVKCYVLDNPHKNIFHCWINHSAACTEGFTWYVFIDEEDGIGFEELKTSEGKFRTVEVSTQCADGLAGILKMWLIGKRGLRREHIKGYIKEFQWRQNHCGEDICISFLQAWGALETRLRNQDDVLMIDGLRDILDWDFSSYIDYNPFDFVPTWTCPGCDVFISGEDWKKERKLNKRGCNYYQNNFVRSYAHETSRC